MGAKREKQYPLVKGKGYGNLLKEILGKFLFSSMQKHINQVLN